MSRHALPVAIVVVTVWMTAAFATARCEACTTAVVSGRATADGRPLLWKNRDFSIVENEVVYFSEGKYPCIGLVNAGQRGAVWMGVNSAGLCMENSLSKDLAFPADIKGLGNGGFILLALQTCATVRDVENLLLKTDETGRSTHANFGVIDAVGGAALFEASHNSHVMYDANDPQVAPEGFIVRSNFSMKGQHLPARPSPDQLAGIYSANRYLRANELISQGLKGEHGLQFLLKNCARDLTHQESACPGSVNGIDGTLPALIVTTSTISRTTTVSYVAIQGVKAGEDPLLTTMWLGLGDPKFSIAVPCWVAAGQVASELQGAQGGPLCQAAIELRAKFFVKESDGILTEGLQTVWAKLWSCEDRAHQVVAAKLNEWRQHGIDARSMAAIHLSSAEQALATISDATRLAPDSEVRVPLTSSP